TVMTTAPTGSSAPASSPIVICFALRRTPPGPREAPISRSISIIPLTHFCCTALSPQHRYRHQVGRTSTQVVTSVLPMARVHGGAWCGGPTCVAPGRLRVVGKRKENQRQPEESLEQWLRRRAADPEGGLPIDPRMMLDLYDR